MIMRDCSLGAKTGSEKLQPGIRNISYLQKQKK